MPWIDIMTVYCNLNLESHRIYPDESLWLNSEFITRIFKLNASFGTMIVEVVNCSYYWVYKTKFWSFCKTSIAERFTLWAMNQCKYWTDLLQLLSESVSLTITLAPLVVELIIFLWLIFFFLFVSNVVLTKV